jgi:hypothetical protein
LKEAKICATAKYSSPSATFGANVVTSSTAFSFFSACIMKKYKLITILTE